VRSVLDMLGRISERTGVTFLLLHHTTKPGQRSARGRAAIRGSGAIFDAASTVLLLERSESTSDRVQVTCEKARGGLGTLPHKPFTITKLKLAGNSFQLTATDDGSRSPPKTTNDTLGNNCARLIQVITAAGGFMASKDELRKRAGIGTGRLNAAIKHLVDTGRLQKERGAIRLIPDGGTSDDVLPPSGSMLSIIRATAATNDHRPRKTSADRLANPRQKARRAKESRS